MSIEISVITDRRKDLEKLLIEVAHFMGNSMNRINIGLKIDFLPDQTEKKKLE